MYRGFWRRCFFVHSFLSGFVDMFPSVMFIHYCFLLHYTVVSSGNMMSRLEYESLKK